MIYSLKKDNYKTFEVFSDNLSAPRSYFIPFSDIQELQKTDIRTERFNSSRVAVLSGDWEFKYYEKVSDMPDEFNTDTLETDKIKVPSMWQFTGYEKPYYVNTRYAFAPAPPYFPEDCSVGVYIKKFIIDDIQGNFCLSFLGVAGSLDVFVNGEYAGYSEGSHNTAEFDITDFLAEGENEIVAVVHKWCNGTYLECQDMFRNNGIFRDVLIIRTGDNSVYDFEAKTKYNTDGSYMLDVIAQFKIKDELTFTAEIKDGENTVAVQSINICPGKTDKVTFDVLDVEEWSAEIPKLYDLYLTLSKDGKTQEIIRKRIGFRHIEIRKNIFYYNNKRIKLLGVNHHDTDAEKGYVLSVSDMERDVRIFKEYNVNCVRTSHYPPDPIFLDLCDEYGIYAVDEADIEAHGVGEIKAPNLISNNLKWKEHYWDRINKMFQRDKNHACITMWSLGNEAGGYRCQDYCYKNLKELTDVPIHYEGACRTIRWSYDVHSEMYTSPKICKRIADGRGLPSKYYKRPFFLCEYAHAMGVGSGDLEKYVRLFYSADNMMGGCIWEFADHAVYHKDGEYKYTYGGDHGEFRHDGNFCVDGLFFPDRTPHTGAIQMKNCYRPVRARLKEKNVFEFTNHSYFKKAFLRAEYAILRNGQEIKNGETQLDIEPTRTIAKSINYEVSEHTVIIFKYFDGDIEIAREQIILSNTYHSKNTASDAAPVIEKSERKIYVSAGDFEIIYNSESGEMESYVYCGKQLINKIPFGAARGFVPELFRAPLDNDMNMKRKWLADGLDKLAFRLIPSKNFYRTEGNYVCISAAFALSTPYRKKAGKFLIHYKISGNGEISVDYCFKNLKFTNLPRLGITFEMPKSFSSVRYYGLDKMSLSDFKEQAVFNITELDVSDMHEKYIKPQESGMRYNTYWAELTDKNGFGLRFESGNSFVFNANHYTVLQCAKAMHAEELKEYDTTVVHLDGFMMGAGSNSCGPIPSAEHRKRKVRRYTNSFTVKPLGKNNV